MSDNNMETKKDKISISKRMLLVVAIILGQFSLLIAVFLLGYNFGQDVGKKQATVDESLGAISSMLGSVANPAQSISGKVTEINNNQISVETSKNGIKTAKLTEQTKVTNKSKRININDIKVGQRVSVFYANSHKDGDFASRIITN